MKMRFLLLNCAMLLVSHAFAQDTQWSDYQASDYLTVSVRYADCHYPEKGINNRYLLIRMVNRSAQPLEISYDLDRSYNGKAINPDVKGHTVTLAPGQTVEASCDDLKAGLHIYAKILGLEAKSVLSDFAITNLNINGKLIGQ